MTHYYDEHQESPLQLRKQTAVLRGEPIHLETASGVFSKRRIDKGTTLLIETAIIQKGWSVLDLGCGVGVVGIAIKKAYPDTQVTFSDVNMRALDVTQKNLKMNHIAHAHVVHSSLYANLPQTFDTILSNPPQSAGKDVCFALIQEAPEHLNVNGLLQIVARHNKGGKTLAEEMKRVFGNVKELEKQSGYRVYVSTKER